MPFYRSAHDGKASLTGFIFWFWYLSGGDIKASGFVFTVKRDILNSLFDSSSTLTPEEGQSPLPPLLPSPPPPPMSMTNT